VIALFHPPLLSCLILFPLAPRNSLSSKKNLSQLSLFYSLLSSTQKGNPYFITLLQYCRQNLINFRRAAKNYILTAKFPSFLED
jgi:hypothetical protein